MNNHQQEAVKYVSGPLLVLAGAGSGKTTVITRKIAYLIKNCQIKPRHIYAVTFTNKAAREMKERIDRLLKDKTVKKPHISTFHTLGLNILKSEHQQLNLKATFTLLDDQDTKSLLTELVHNNNLNDKLNIEALQHKISQWKNSLCEPNTNHLIFNEEDALCMTLYQQYEQTLRAYNAVDFDDLITKPVLLFKNNADMLARWQEKVHYLLVDECQDTNVSQYALIRQLAGLRAQFTLVGDDDQSIYAWRGARPENMALLQNDFPGLKVIKLEQNYRSTRLILDAANQLIANNPHVFTKTLWSNMEEGDPIRVIRCRNEEAEANRIATEILTHRLRLGKHYRDYAILYRGNHQSRLLEIKLQQHQIPYHITGGTSFFARSEIKDLLAYLRLVINTDDDAAFLRIINTPRREIGAATIEKLGLLASEHNMSLYKSIDVHHINSIIDARYLNQLQHFSESLKTWQKLCSHETPEAIARTIMTDIDYKGWLTRESASNATAGNRWNNIEILLASIESMTSNNDSATTIEDVVSKLILQDILDRQEEKNDDDKVHLMTLHSSKGLEFPYVFLVGTEEDILPHRSSIEEDTIEEERRLAYVGITRARKNLTLTLTEMRKQFGEIVHSEPSRFIGELPQQHLIYSGFESENKNSDQRKLQGKTALKLMREQLDN